MAAVTQGIDLGTSNSVAAYVRDGHPHVISVEGWYSVPSVVCFAEGEDPSLYTEIRHPESGEPLRALVGRPAVERAKNRPETAVRKAKRMMGTDHVYRVERREYTPQMIAAFILRSIADAAQAEPDVEIRGVRITVPAYFDTNRRKAT